MASANIVGYNKGNFNNSDEGGTRSPIFGMCFTPISGEKAKLGDFKPAEGEFAESRYRKELIRAVCYAAGTPVTQFKGNIFTIAKARDLDHCPEMIPIDTMQRTAFRLKDLGVMPSYKTTYRKACVDGWAPAPTNEYQKAIWDKVHAMPTAPIKIKPETKKVKE